MSHKGTNWAIQQRGLKPATKLVLWFLADRHNPDLGCFPMQSTLASDAEMSVSSLNDHLAKLEEAGLIQRRKRVDRKTGKQLSTRYILRFEDAWAQEPSPKSGDGEADLFAEGSGDNLGDNPAGGSEAVSGKPPDPSPKNGDNRLRNSETNPVSEPVKEPEKKSAGARDPGRFNFSQAGWTRLLLIAGYPEGATLPSWWRGEVAVGHVKGWMDRFGFDEETILRIAEDAREGRVGALEGPLGLDDAMLVAHRGKQPKPPVPSKKEDPPPDRKAVLDYYAEWVNSDRFLPPNAMSANLGRELVGCGLVTADRARERGL